MSSRRLTLRTLATLSVLGVAILGFTAAEAAIQPAPDVPVSTVCAALPDPLPTGITQMPADQWADPTLFTNPTTSNDYHWIHSSTNLQGAQALEKWGACVFFNPDASQTSPVDMTDWRSMVVVNNPSPTLTVHAKITYYDPTGILVASYPITLLPEQTFEKGAVELRQFGPGIGSVQVTADNPIVGATLHHFGKIRLGNGILYSDPDYLSPGEGMEQQLQMPQDFATVLYSGPFPLTNSAAEDFLNGNLPLNCIVNPNSLPASVTVTNVIAPATTLNSQTVTLPAHGMFLDTSIWAAAEPTYLSPTGFFNVDIITAASSNRPILGDFLMVDVFGNGAPYNLNPGTVFRAGSGMIENSPALRLINGEHTETGPLSLPGPLAPTPPVTTMMSVANVTSNNIGPVNVQFFARTGGPPIQTLTFASLAPGVVQRIIPSTSAIPQNFAGWARITACQPGLIGWTMREVMDQGQVMHTAPIPQFHKAYGEELDGANGGEPGKGFTAATTTGTYIRKVAPFLRAAGNFDFPNWWPSYVNGVNQGSSNIGNYWHRFFTIPGGALAGQQNFTGLRFANTSFTFVDPIVNLIGAGSNVSGRFDRTTGTTMGMEAVGDPMIEWNVPMFLGSDVGNVLPQE